MLDESAALNIACCHPKPRTYSNQLFEVAAMLALELAERSSPEDSDSGAQTWTTPFLSESAGRLPYAGVALLFSLPLTWEQAINPALQSDRPPLNQVVALVWGRSAIVMYRRSPRRSFVRDWPCHPSCALPNPAQTRLVRVGKRLFLQILCSNTTDQPSLRSG